MEKKINVSINEGGAFFAHEASINFSPQQFVLDFKCVTPRVDPRSSEAPTLHIAHNVIMLEPFHAKKLHELMGDMIARYEKEFTKIDKTKAMEKAEKKKMKAVENKEQPTYFG